MRELDAIKVTPAGALEPGHECTLNVAHPHPDTVLLSHFEVTKLSPRGGFAELTELRVEKLHYLLTPVPLPLIESEQQIRHSRAMRERLKQLQSLVGILRAQHMLQLIKPDRRVTRLVALDIHWKPQQPLTVTFKNSGTSVVDEISIELVIYSLSSPLAPRDPHCSRTGGGCELHPRGCP